MASAAVVARKTELACGEEQFAPAPDRIGRMFLRNVILLRKNGKAGAPETDRQMLPDADGAFAYTSRDALIDFLVGHILNPDNTPETVRRA